MMMGFTVFVELSADSSLPASLKLISDELKSGVSVERPDEQAGSHMVIADRKRILNI